jgi:O-antigen ligase
MFEKPVQLLISFFTRSNIQFFILSILVISFPWSSKFSSFPIIALMLWYVLDKSIIQKLKTAMLNKEAWLFYMVFIWYAIWTICSGPNADVGGTMERKILFLLFPIIFSSENYIGTKRLHYLLMLLFASCVVGALVCEIFAFYNYYKTGMIFYFIYENLSTTIFWHAGHMSNYYCLVIIWWSCVYLKLIPRMSNPSILQIIGFVFIVIFIIQLTSKTIMLFLILFLPWLLFIYIKQIKTKKQIILLVVGLSLLSGGFYIFNQKMMPGRFSVGKEISQLDTSVLYRNSVGSRYMAMYESFQKVKPVWYKGFGTGEANNKLMEQLVAKKYSDLIKWKMHTHNQYMHTWLDIGLFGTLYIIALFLYALFIFFKRKNYLGSWFVVLILINLLTDDMLEIQAGLVFFLFWVSILLFKPNLPEEAIP